MYIGGDGLARGYLNRPELTADNFVPHPFNNDSGTRLYRTGDLARYRPEGAIEFLGRIDHQVKIRGFRIELGEIEAVLGKHPGVRETVVLAREDIPGEKRLVAYAVPQQKESPRVSEWRHFLKERLPDYMLPQAFVFLEALPLTPSGKVNRRALPAPDESRPELQAAFVAPRNLLEERLATIWREVLGIDEVGIYDNFFALGGHSLLATQVVVRASEVLQVNLPLRKLFEAPTIAELTAEITALRSGTLSSPGKALTGIDRERVDRLPLSFCQQRLWFFEQMEGELAAFNMPFAWRLRGTIDEEAFRRALEAIVQRHQPLRTMFTMVDEEPVQVVRTIERFDLPVLHQPWCPLRS